MTRGDNHNIKCPYCGKVQHHVVTDARAVPVGVTTEFTRPCYDCKRPVYYWASWEIVLRAEKEGEVL